MYFEKIFTMLINIFLTKTSLTYNLEVSYANGLGVDKNFEEAIKWFLAAANQGMAEAQYNMGNAYSKGEGVEVNKATAKAWLQKACANGYKPACDVLKNKK